jgi:S1-C subfamily serine protease
MRGHALFVVLGASFLWSPIVAARGPSFDCRKATFPDEFVICRTPELSALDNRIASAYARLRNTRGRSFADEVKIPTLRRRQACRSDALCIKERQIAALDAYRAAGAPVLDEATSGLSKEPAMGGTSQNKAESKGVQSGLVSSPNSLIQQPAGAPSREPQPPHAQPHSVTTGAGIFITPEGHVLTTAHLVEDCSEIRVGVGQGNYEIARLVARDTTNDLALLQVTAKPPRVATLRFGVRLGENIEEFGRPPNQSLATSGDLAIGSVSDLAGIAGDSRYLQVSAATQPGGSGDPLLDENGYIVGIVSSELNSIAALRAAGDIPQNVNFGIKATIAAKFLQDNNVKFQVGEPSQPMQVSDIADEAKALSVFIECR